MVMMKQRRTKSEEGGDVEGLKEGGDVEGLLGPEESNSGSKTRQSQQHKQQHSWVTSTVFLLRAMAMLALALLSMVGASCIYHHRRLFCFTAKPDNKYNDTLEDGGGVFRYNDTLDTICAGDLPAGTDLSEVLMVEDGGGVFRYANGTVAKGGGVEIVRQHGYCWARVRIMVDPVGTYGLAQDLDYVVRLARSIFANNIRMKFLLDFHYSHWWTDGQNQWTPSRWKGEDIQHLRDGVYQYTARVLRVLQQEKVFPDAIQFGNEISPGMLWPLGKLPFWTFDKNSTMTDSLPQEWKNLVGLIQTGIKAMDDVIETSYPPHRPRRPKIVIHLDTGGDTEFCQHWMETYLALGGACDVIGLSWYPMWHGTLKDLHRNIDNLSLRFPQQEVWLVETAYYWDGFCDKDDAECNAKLPFPLTEQGQSDHLHALRQMLLQTKCRAVFYWGSHWTQPQNWFRSEAGETWEDAERRALFDRTGRVLKGMATLAGN